jgi:outer membrane protein OmpA-like peptidoglycan-associated protein
LDFCTLCTASVNVYLREYDQPVQNRDRHSCNWCPISFKLSWTLSLSLLFASAASAQNGFKLYMAPASNLPAPAAKTPKPGQIKETAPKAQAPAIFIPSSPNSDSRVDATSAPLGKIYYPTSNGRPVVIDAALDPDATLTPKHSIKPVKPQNLTTTPAALPAQLKPPARPGQPARVGPDAVIHTSADDFVPKPKTVAPLKTQKKEPNEISTPTNNQVSADTTAKGGEEKPFTGSAAPVQDPATNKHIGANFSNDAEVKAIKEAAQRRYDYVLPKVIAAPVNFKVVQSSGFVTYILPSDKLFINDHAVFAIKADNLLEELLPHVAKMADHPLIIRVHTDNLGFDHYNTKLSKARGDVLKEWLVKHGSMHNVEIEVEGVGGRKPLAPNSLAGGADNVIGRAQNRRVEIFIDTNVSVTQKLAAAKAAALAEAIKDQSEQTGPVTRLQNGMTAGRAQLQQASKEAGDALPAALQEIGPLSDEGMEPVELEENVETASENGDSRQQANWDRVSNNQANRKNLNAEGKRVVPAMTDQEKMQLKKDRDWARGEFGLFLEK